MAKKREEKKMDAQKEPLDLEKQVADLMARVDKQEAENAALRAALQTTKDGQAVIVPDNTPITTRAHRAQFLPEIQPSEPGKIVRYASKYSIERRTSEGWYPHPTAKSVGDAIPVETDADNPILAERRKAKKALQNAGQNQLQAEARAGRALHPSRQAETFTEYERKRGGPPS